MSFTTRPEIRGTHGVIATTHWLATMAGWRMFELGGNAFDAAAAAGFALQVVEPHQNGLGGDMPAVFHSARTGRTQVVCGQGVAPAAATISQFRALGLGLIPGNGLLPAVVPGAFDAWMLLLRDHGMLGLRDVMAPAIGYARDAYAVVPMLQRAIAAVADLFRNEWRHSAATYLANGATPATGALLRNPVLADTYERLLREGEAAGGGRDAQIEAARTAFYDGFVAEAIDDFCRTTLWLDASGERHGGLLTGSDMSAWRARYEEPVTYDYHGLTVCKCGPWSQGPVFLQQLALLKGFDVATMDPLGAEFAHTQIEACKLAMADREAWYGDPDFVDVPLSALLSDTYNDAPRALIGEQASLDLRPGNPDGHRPKLPAFGVDMNPSAPPTAGLGDPTHPPDGDTAHLDVADHHGNMISCTPSGGWLQSSPVIPSLGMSLGTRAQMFWLQDGLATTLMPGARPRTTLSPGLALRDGAPVLAFGTPGGDQQDQWALSLFLRIVHYGMNLAEAVDAPLFHSDHHPSSFFPRRAKPGSVAIESRFPEATLNDLARRGHRLEDAGPWALGRLTAVGCERRNGDTILTAAAHPRFQQAYAVGR